MHIPDGATLMGIAAIINSIFNLILMLRADLAAQSASPACRLFGDVGAERDQRPEDRLPVLDLRS